MNRNLPRWRRALPYDAEHRHERTRVSDLMLLATGATGVLLLVLLLLSKTF